MSYATIPTLINHGRRLTPARLEVRLIKGMPSFEFAGLVDRALREANQRLRAALDAMAYDYPRSRMLISFQPASVPKRGSLYDAALALLLLIASGQVKPRRNIEEILVLGELSLNAELKPTPDMGLLIEQAGAFGFDLVLIPESYRAFYQKPEGVTVLSFKTFLELVDFLEGRPIPRHLPLEGVAPQQDSRRQALEARLEKLAAIPAQQGLLKALEVAAAGWHPLLILGAPGTGKTYLAETLAVMLPPLSEAEHKDYLKLQAMMPLAEEAHYFKRRPFVAAHHSVTKAALIGGGRPIHPGLISKAHHGVLFLDELTEFDMTNLDLLRQALSAGRMVLHRDSERLEVPADFLLLAAANPCPCGYFLEENGRCGCRSDQVARYLGKISGPLWDRFQLLATTRSFQASELLALTDRKEHFDLAALKERVQRAIHLQKERASAHNLSEWRNGRQQESDLIDLFRISRKVAEKLSLLAAQSQLSARAYRSLIMVARTLADLKGEEDLGEEELFTAACYLPQRNDVLKGHADVS